MDWNCTVVLERVWKHPPFCSLCLTDWPVRLCVLQDVGRSHSGESDESDDSDSDNFSVEFEVESINSDAYSENDEDSVPGEDEVSALFCDAAAVI